MDTLLSNAQNALAEVESYSQPEIDVLIKALGESVHHHAESLARLALDETHMGVYEHKVLKNQRKAFLIHEHLKNKPSVGVIERNPERGITRIAKPVGLIGALTPVTNPTTTPLGNAMIALKGRNAIIIAPHPSAYRTTSQTVHLMRQAIAECGGPLDLIQILPPPPTREATLNLMRSVDVIVATGGASMVKAAYSSGKPAYGVGPGNVQVILDQKIDHSETARMVIEGRCFDHGIICSCEQSVHYPLEEEDKVWTAFEAAGGILIKDPDQIATLRETLFPEGSMNHELIGQSVQRLGEAAGLRISPEKKALVISGVKSPEDPLRKEKMFPVLTLFSYQDIETAIGEALTNLKLEGIGHSCVVHSESESFIEQIALALPVSRIIVNQSSPSAAGGSFHNALTPSTTLGCGSWGNNSLSENLDYHHLLNIEHIAYPLHENGLPCPPWGAP